MVTLASSITLLFCHLNEMLRINLGQIHPCESCFILVILNKTNGSQGLMQLFQYSSKVMHFDQVYYDLCLLNSNLRVPGNLPSQQEADTMTVNCGIIYVHVYIYTHIIRFMQIFFIAMPCFKTQFEFESIV